MLQYHLKYKLLSFKSNCPFCGEQRHWECKQDSNKGTVIIFVCFSIQKCLLDKVMLSPKRSQRLVLENSLLQWKQVNKNVMSFSTINSSSVKTFINLF